MTKIFRGHILHMIANPQDKGSAALESVKDGAIVVSERGIILESGAFSKCRKLYPSASVLEQPKSFLLPTFTDTHTHFPQLDIMGIPCGELLPWLEQITFPCEMRFADPEVARTTAHRFCMELLRHGIGAAAIFSSNHLEATHVIAEECHRLGLRAIIGKPSMDRLAPPELLSNAQADLNENRIFIDRWHKKSPRIFAALTPRFAPSCSEAMMSNLTKLLEMYPDLYVQTHHSENIGELDLVRKLFPNDKTYLHIYDRFGLIHERTILAHSIHCHDEEIKLLTKRKALIAHCPSSNLFLGSGLFSMKQMLEADIPVNLATDVGAGTTFSMWRLMDEAYKISKLKGEPVTPCDLFYAATLGPAKALGWSEHSGSLEKGKDADFQVVSLEHNPQLHAKMEAATESPEQQIANFMFFSTESDLREVYLQGARKSFGPTPVPT